MLWLCLPSFLLAVALVSLIKIFHWERHRRLLFVLGFLANLVWPPVWFFWPDIPFLHVPVTVDLLIWSFTACMFPVLIFWITLAIGDRLVLGTD